MPVRADGLRRWGLLTRRMLVLLALMASGCAVFSDGPTKHPDPSFSASSQPSLDGRPLRRVPDVRPTGFSAPPPGRGLGRYRDQRLDWRKCQDGLQCATVLAPLDYASPDGTAITLSLARRQATANTRIGTLFINPGGPGGSGVGYAGSFDRQGLEGYDIVGWDPRGVGASTPVECAGGISLDDYVSMDISPDDVGEQEALADANRRFGLSCLRASGSLLQHVSTVETARDLELLTRLVGDAKTSFLGSSYGTRIGATFAGLFPYRVGRMVLDGAVNITADTSVTQAQGFDRALGAFADWCAGRGCRLGGSKAEVLSSVVRLLDRLDATPLDVGRRELTQQLALAGILRFLYENDKIYPYLLKALTETALDSNGKYLLAVADQSNFRSDNGAFGQINYAFPAVRCLDSGDLGVRGEIARATAADRTAPTVGPFFGPDLTCAMWPVAAVPESWKITARGAPPIIVLGTTGDPATPYEHAVGMADQLASGVLVTFRGHGHLAYSQSPCVRQLVVRYLLDGVVPADGTTC